MLEAPEDTLQHMGGLPRSETYFPRLSREFVQAEAVNKGHGDVGAIVDDPLMGHLAQVVAAQGHAGGGALLGRPGFEIVVRGGAVQQLKREFVVVALPPGAVDGRPGTLAQEIEKVEGAES